MKIINFLQYFYQRNIPIYILTRMKLHVMNIIMYFILLWSLF